MTAHQEILAQTNFSPIDWVIVAVYLSGTLAVGFLARKVITNMADYVVAGRKVGTALGVATMMGTEMGLVTVMYSSQKGFVGGFAAFHIALVMSIVVFLVGITGFLVCKLRALGVLTIPEFYGKRFGPRTRILGGIMLALGGILNMGLFLKVGSMFVVAITGLQHEAALAAVMVVLLTLVLIYTILGGMVSVIITDYAQFVVLSFCLLLTCFLAIREVGWTEVFDFIAEHKGAAGFNPLMEGTFGVEYMVWMGFLGIVTCAVWQPSVMRALASESEAVVRKQYMWSSVSFLIRFLIPYFWGICAFVFIMKTPDLKAAFFPENGEPALNNLYAMPVFLSKILPVGVIGLVTAGMLAAFMSTHDSYLLCWSAVITQDVIAPLRKKEMSTEARLKMTRILILVIGLYVLYWGLVYEGADDIWDYMAVTGAIYFTGAFALLAGGLYWKRASSTGAVMSLLGGLCSFAGLSPVQDFLGFKMSSAWVGILSVIFCSLLLLVGSLLFPDKKEEGSTK